MVADGRKDHYSLGAVASPAYEPEHSSSTEFLEPDQISFSPISFHSSRISSMVQSPNQFENIPATRALQTLTSRPSTVSPLSYMTRAAVIKWLRRNRSKIDFASAPKWTDASAKRLPYRSPSRLQLHKEYLKFQVEITTVKRLIEYLRVVEGSYPPPTGPHATMLKDDENQSGPKDGSFESLVRSRLEVLKLQQQMTLQSPLEDVLHAYRELPFVPKGSK
ncbi:hypothetical protein BS47DRAFT_829381 [Hydnum rufescens UP504]|uniref:Uncharacterized protein n=1 Tax=Hydnum rufescens UP504 TaxID=1448309 RepID=A0A9P6DXK1_9AGAM|nr:hypothetical protein BS47DRAFT_829381 [Hydnum rufescens UP504]